MFDFVNYTFSGLMSIFGAVMGLAYPIILQSIQRIDEQYNSTRLASQFQQEFVFKLFQAVLFINIIISTLSPFILYLGGINYTVVIVSIQTLFVSALMFILFSLFTVIRVYYDPKRLCNRLKSLTKNKEVKMMDEFSKNDSTKLIRELQCIFDVSVYAARRADYDIYYAALSEISYFVYEYQRRSNIELPIVYPQGFMKIFNEIKFHSSNIKEQNYFYYQNNITSLLYNSSYKHIIADETYKYLWYTLNEIIKANNKAWFNQYWSWADQYYNFTFTAFMSEIHTNNNEKKRFYEHHIMIGALLNYNKKYDWLENIMFFTNQSPPSYHLIPSTLIAIFNQIMYFKEHTSYMRLISARYTFSGMNADVNTDYYIYNEISSYLALLTIRLFLVNDYNITYSDPMELPEIGEKIEDNEYYINLVETLKSKVELWYKEDSNKQIPLPSIPLKKNVLTLLDSYIKICNESIEKINMYPTIENDKIIAIKNKLHHEEVKLNKNIITKNYHTFITNKIESSEYDIKDLILPYTYQLGKSEILKGSNSISVNLEEVLMQVLYNKIYSSYVFQFINIRSVIDYSISYSNIFKAIMLLNLDPNKHIVLSIGIYLGNFINIYGDIDGFIYNPKENKTSYNGISIIDIISNEQALIIIDKADLPYYEFQKLDESDYKPITSDSNLYSNLDSIDPVNRILKLKFYLKYYYKENCDYIRLNITNNLPLGNNGDLDSIKPFDKLKKNSPRSS